MACIYVTETAVLEHQHVGTRRLRCNINVIKISHADSVVTHTHRHSCHVVFTLTPLVCHQSRYCGVPVHSEAPSMTTCASYLLVDTLYVILKVFTVNSRRNARHFLSKYEKLLASAPVSPVKSKHL